MTFPPCFSSSFAARSSSGISTNTTNNNGNTMSNMQLAKLHQEDMVRQQWRSMMFSQLSIPSTRIFPDLLPQESEGSKPEEDEQEQECHQDMMNEEQDMEDKAARMLLELSQIVSKEVSADSGCIKRESIQDTVVHKNEEFHQISKDLHSPNTRDFSDSNFDRVSPCVAIPKSIEIHNHYVQMCSPLQSNIPSPQNSNSNNFEIFGPSSTTEPPRRMNRYRTVSLAGDEMNMNMNITHPVDQREQLSPKLMHPLSSSPLPSKDLVSSFPSIHEDRKRHFPLELPPQLLYNNNNNQKNPVAASEQAPKQVFAIAVRSYNTTTKAKPSKRAASAAKSSAALAQKTTYRNVLAKKKAKRNPNRKTRTGKKFSWKAYPELEQFLITNREEYLSFSAKNYTIEQRDYNNRLTSRLLEHAEASGYSALFESCAFSAVRDRIRSYYKSYVQSFKRRKERQGQQERLFEARDEMLLKKETNSNGETFAE